MNLRDVSSILSLKGSWGDPSMPPVVRGLIFMAIGAGLQAIVCFAILPPLIGISGGGMVTLGLIVLFVYALLRSFLAKASEEVTGLSFH